MSEVAAAIRGLMDPLVVRLRGPAIDALAGRLARGETGLVGLVGLVVAAPRAVAGLREAHAAVAARQARAEAEVHAAGSPAARREALARVLQREVRDRRRRRGDLRALRRDLDLDALRERFAGEREALEVQVELAVLVVGRGLARLAPDATAAAALRRAGLVEFLVAQAGWVPRFTLRQAAIAGLLQCCETLGAADPDGVVAAAMQARAGDVEEHAWVRAAALGVWARVAPGEARRVFGAALAGEPLAAPGLAFGTGDAGAGQLAGETGEAGQRAVSGEIGETRGAAMPAGDAGDEQRAVSGASGELEVAGGALGGVGAAGSGLVEGTGEAAPAADAGGLSALLAEEFGESWRTGVPDPALAAALVEEASAAGVAGPIGDEAADVRADEDAGDVVGPIVADESTNAGPIDRAGASAVDLEFEIDEGPWSSGRHPAGLTAASGPAMRMAGGTGTADAGGLAEGTGVVDAGVDGEEAELAEGTDAADAAPAPISARAAAIAATDPGGRGFLLRRLVVDALARRTDAWAVDLLAEAVGDEDPSAHVRIGLCQAAVAVARREPGRGAAMLAALAAPRREASPQVRAWALQSAAAIGADEVLVRGLIEDAATVPLLVACRVAATRGGPAIARALVELAAHPERPAAVHEAAAAALEAIDAATDRGRAAWTEVLATALARTKPGGSTTVTLARDGLPRPTRTLLGRVLAALTREDWGVDADVRGDRLVLRRGDRWTTRLWRVIHELRRPAPGKRAAHPHGRGRVVRGTLRAPSGRLHEVTATGVPGERVHVEREGGWGRHLPRVDDILGLPVLGTQPVEVYSSHGVCRLRWRVGLAGRLAARTRLALRYAWLAELRLQALEADEDAIRGRYVAALRGLGIEATFVAHPAPVALAPGPEDMARRTGTPRPLPAQLRALFPAEATIVRPPAAAGERAAAAGFVAAPELYEWLATHGHYFLSVSANSQQALAYFLVLLTAVVCVGAFVRRRQIRRARAAIPLVIGGWGTRGKSGTERLKQGLLHGLGYRVFAKTTGCEAMFLHAAPQGPPLEIFTFRPYGKATIWEQRTLLRLAADLHADVFLWECMALTPAYVEILQRHWMRDDLATITNAYPDHEDIQGPAGIDVAEVIARFVPDHSTLVTSEVNFLPVMQAAADRNHTALTAIDDRAGDMIAPDLLALLPYDEHPRNVALVARLAETLGIDPTLAIVTMARHVVPDLGVLKRFGPARLRGRVLEFLNGCSANERTGFLSNWRRTGCDALDLTTEPDHYVITAVNNREDRVARSQVFARVLVEDVAVDRHVLLGTNTRGLVGYIQSALATFLAAQAVVTAADMAEETGPETAHRRLARLLARLRIVPPRAGALAHQLEVFARGAGVSLPAATRAEAARRAAPWLTVDTGQPVLLPEVQAAVAAELEAWASEAITTVASAGPQDPPEVDAPAAAAEVAAHWVRQVARTTIAARLHARLDACLAGGPQAIEPFHRGLRAAYEALFLELVDVIEDAHSTGDQVVLRCALAAPPGVRVTVMGTQNIKGTGLDFVYRWIALEAAQRDLTALASRDPAVRAAAWQRLESPADPGLIDAGLVAARLTAMTPPHAEAPAHARALARAEALHRSKRAGLTGSKRSGRAAAAIQWIEGWVDYLDGVVRHRRARQVMRDLVDQRIGHARAALVMRDLDARAKGGWLARRWLRRPG